MKPSKVDTIAIWPVSKTQRKVQMFLRFANFYCCFILGFSKIAAVFSAMLKGETNGKFKGVKFVWIKKTLKSFIELKQLFVCAPMLIHYDPSH